MQEQNKQPFAVPNNTTAPAMRGVSYNVGVAVCTLLGALTQAEQLAILCTACDLYNLDSLTKYDVTVVQDGGDTVDPQQVQALNEHLYRYFV